MANDRRESKNIAAQLPELAARMVAIMEHEHVDDPNWPTLTAPKKGTGKTKAKKP